MHVPSSHFSRFRRNLPRSSNVERRHFRRSSRRCLRPLATRLQLVPHRRRAARTEQALCRQLFLPSEDRCPGRRCFNTSCIAPATVLDSASDYRGAWRGGSAAANSRPAVFCAEAKGACAESTIAKAASCGSEEACERENRGRFSHSCERRRCQFSFTSITRVAFSFYHQHQQEQQFQQQHHEKNVHAARRCSLAAASCRDECIFDCGFDAGETSPSRRTRACGPARLNNIVFNAAAAHGRRQRSRTTTARRGGEAASQGVGLCLPHRART
jgi:hypothetical protein